MASLLETRGAVSVLMVCLLLPALLSAQLAEGDLLVGTFTIDPSVGHYRPDGTLVASFGGNSTAVIGISYLLDGRIIATLDVFPGTNGSGQLIFIDPATGASILTAIPEVTRPADLQQFT